MYANRYDFVVIGAGPGGLSAARTATNLGKSVLILEKMPYPGGKCRTYNYPSFDKPLAEFGAMVLAPNYGIALDIIQEFGIKLQRSFRIDRNSMEFLQHVDGLSIYKKIKFYSSLLSQLYRFNMAVSKYYKCLRNNANELPSDLYLPFSEYSKKHNLKNLSLLIKSIVTGFGYGAMSRISTYSVLTYLGYMTLPAIIFSRLFGKEGLLEVRSGFQDIFTKLANYLDSIPGNNLITSAKISTIIRDEKQVIVSLHTGEQFVADKIVLALSPVYWLDLGMTLTNLEQAAVRNVSFYQHPVAICKIYGLNQSHYYSPRLLQEEAFGHVYFISSKDKRANPEDGRLATAYINLPSNKAQKVPRDVSLLYDVDGTLSKQQLEIRFKTDLEIMFPDKKVEILDLHIWPDYMSLLPWKISNQLAKINSQGSNNTIYVGPYVNSFEDIACVVTQADEAIQSHYNIRKRERPAQHLSRLIFFYSKESQHKGITHPSEDSRR